MKRRQFLKNCAGLAAAVAVPVTLLAKSDRWHCQYHETPIEDPFEGVNDLVEGNGWPCESNQIGTADLKEAMRRAWEDCRRLDPNATKPYPDVIVCNEETLMALREAGIIG